MLYTLLNFIWIALTTFLLGILIISIVQKIMKINIVSLDSILISGLVFATVYAETWSFFYKVRFLANAFLFLICTIIIICFRKKILVIVKNVSRTSNIRNKVLLLALLFIGLMIASQKPEAYDTALYHAQAIHWIEEYGCTKGLGNLHNRFAYNSSFLCLQALYSWASIVGQSLHGMNAYIAVILVGYAVMSFRFFKIKKESIADAFNLTILLYIGYSISTLSSPHTDFLAMSLILYIISKWFRAPSMEEKSLLCILAIFGCTVKLTVAPLVLLALCPLIDFFKHKKWKYLLFCTIMGIVIVIPFLVRNIFILGYLIYPYPVIDIFDFDWKMPSYTVMFDHNEIVSWGRGIKDAYLYDLRINEWLPVWFQSLTITEKYLILINIILMILLMFWVITCIKKKQYELIYLYCVFLTGMFMWFFSAPLIRYGRVYLYILPAFVIGLLLQKECAAKTIIKYAATIVCTIYICYSFSEYAKNVSPLRLIMPEDYKEYSSDTITWEKGVKIYTVTKGDQSGYNPFPMIPYASRLDLIELRGDTLKDGFRMKEEYQKAKVNTYGSVE